MKKIFTLLLAGASAAAKKTFISTWADNMGTGIMAMEVAFTDQAAKKP